MDDKIFVREMVIPEQWRAQPVEPIESIVQGSVGDAVTVQTRLALTSISVTRGKARASIMLHRVHPHDPVESLVVGAKDSTSESRSLVNDICSQLERAGFHDLDE